jgi:hypothetical protein
MLYGWITFIGGLLLTTVVSRKVWRREPIKGYLLAAVLAFGAWAVFKTLSDYGLLYW